MVNGLLIKVEKLKGKMVTFLLYKNIYFKSSFLIYNTKCCIVKVYHASSEKASQYDFSESLKLYLTFFCSIY